MGGGGERKTEAVLTVAAHSLLQAFLQSAILTPVPMMLGDLAVLRASALVPQLFPDGPLEEPLAPFAAYCTVMPPWNGRFLRLPRTLTLPRKPPPLTGSSVSADDAQLHRQAQGPDLIRAHVQVQRLIHLQSRSHVQVQSLFHFDAG